MSYVVLARRYRPQVFSDLVGQEHVTMTLKNALKTGRTAHAYLFTGPRGVGKTSAARILAKALRCLEPTADFEPCNHCIACTSLNDGSSLDVLEIDAASNTGVDNIRELRENVGYMATVGKYRIYIVDEVHMLSTAAFNALLKTLEEPPPHVVFIFATTEIHKVLPTIQSRCQRFDFKKISSETIAKNLRDICVDEKVEIDEGALRTIVDESEGCLRDAQSLLDQAIALCGTQIKMEVLETALGLVDRGSFLELMQNVGAHDAGAALKLCSRILDRGIDAKVLLGRIVRYLRDLHYLAFTNEVSDADPAWETSLKKVCPLLSPDEIVRGMELALKSQTSLYGALDPSLLVEALIVKLCLQRPVGRDVVLALPIPERTEQRPPPPTPARENAPAPRPAASLGLLETYIHSKKPAWTPVLGAIHSAEVKDDAIFVKSKNDFAGRRLASADGLDLLKLAYGVKRAVVQLDAPVAAELSSVSLHEKIAQKRSLAKEHDAVKSAIRIFDATITETKVLEGAEP